MTRSGWVFLAVILCFSCAQLRTSQFSSTRDFNSSSNEKQLIENDSNNPAHLVLVGDYPEPEQGTLRESAYILQFTCRGEKIKLVDSPTPASLYLAAELYALASKDYEVSLSDIVNSGFFPYSDTIRNLDYSSEFYTWSEPSVPLPQNFVTREDTESVEWVLEAKERVLILFNSEICTAYAEFDDPMRQLYG